MSEAQAELVPQGKPQLLLEVLKVIENPTHPAIGVLVLCGQGPVQDRRTKVKIGTQHEQMPGTVADHEANTWMRLIARAAGELDQTGEVGLIIPSGGGSRSGTYERLGQQVAPTEAELMQDIIESVYGTYAPQSTEKHSQAEIELDPTAHNTLDNLLNAINLIDKRKQERINNKLPEDPNLDNVWFVVSHFHLPRIRVLAAYFGFDPKHVLSAEEILMASSKIKEKETVARGQTDPTGFDRQASFRALIQARLGRPVKPEHAGYFDKKLTRADSLLDREVDEFLRIQNISDAERPAKKAELKKKLYIEEQKSAQMRMKDERRWVRGLAQEVDYVLPYAQSLKDDQRLLQFFLKFNTAQLASYGIERRMLEQITPETLSTDLATIRYRMDAEDWKKSRWKWQVVKAEWQDEEYPEEVKKRFRDLGIADSDIEALSKAEVPPLIDQSPRSFPN